MWKNEVHKRSWRQQGGDVESSFWNPADELGPQFMVLNVSKAFETGEEKKLTWGLNSAWDRMCAFNLCLCRCLAHDLIISLPLVM